MDLAEWALNMGIQCSSTSPAPTIHFFSGHVLGLVVFVVAVVASSKQALKYINHLKYTRFFDSI